MPSIHVLVILIALLLGRELGQAQVLPCPLALGLAAGWVAMVGLVAVVALPAVARAAAYRGSWRLLVVGHGLARWLRWLVVLPYAAWAVLGDAVGCVQGWVGDWIGLDEGLAAAAPMLGLLCIVWGEHPLHDRMRQALLVRRLDEGRPVHRPPTRVEDLLAAARAMLAMPLLPVLAIVCWHEVVDRAAGWPALGAGAGPGWLVQAIDLLGTLAIVALSPAWIVRVLDTRPIASGSLAERAQALAEAMGTRLGRLRLWRHGSANAAVLGLLPGARYLLVTEAVLQDMPGVELDAVIAHELAHLRERHVLWIVLSLLGLTTLLGLLEWPLAQALERGLGFGQAVAGNLALGLLGVLVVHGFGVVSRLCERHADAHAALAVGQPIAQKLGLPTDRVHPAGPQAMADALERVCILNGTSPERWGFRHGSVRQRQRALMALVGQPVHRLPIDRAMRRLRWASLLGLVLTAGALALAFGQGA